MAQAKIQTYVEASRAVEPPAEGDPSVDKTGTQGDRNPCRQQLDRLPQNMYLIVRATGDPANVVSRERLCSAPGGVRASPPALPAD